MEKFTLKLLSIVIVLGMTLSGSWAFSNSLTKDEKQKIAMEAFIYFYPTVILNITRDITTNLPQGVKPMYGPENTLFHNPKFPDASFREVVRPNFDTLYTTAWLNLKKEPVVISVPDTKGRYYILQMLDSWTDVFSSPGSRTSGTNEQTLLISGPGWKGHIPGGMIHLKSPTNVAWMIGRIQTNGVEDYAAVRNIQKKFKLEKLSAHQGGKASGNVHSLNSAIDMDTPPLHQVNNMSAKDFFEYALALLKENPPHHSDGSMLLRMQRLGILSDKPLKFNKLDDEMQEILRVGAKMGLSKIIKKSTEFSNLNNGWFIRTDMGVYGNDYLYRASIAMLGLGANEAEDAVYPFLVVDTDGKPLVGEENYVMHFAAGQLPPADAFWSITMYDEEGFPIENRIKRYAIGDADNLKYNRDGSLDIYIQTNSPGKKKASNWLPSSQSGIVSIAMRVYVPRNEILNGTWIAPKVRRMK